MNYFGILMNTQHPFNVWKRLYEICTITFFQRLCMLFYFCKLDLIFVAKKARGLIWFCNEMCKRYLFPFVKNLTTKLLSLHDRNFKLGIILSFNRRSKRSRLFRYLNVACYLPFEYVCLPYDNTTLHEKPNFPYPNNLKDGWPKQAAVEYDLSCIIRNGKISFCREYDIIL